MKDQPIKAIDQAEETPPVFALNEKLLQTETLFCPHLVAGRESDPVFRASQRIMELENELLKAYAELDAVLIEAATSS